METEKVSLWLVQHSQGLVFEAQREEIQKLRMVSCTLNPALVCWHNNGKLGVFCINIDDILYAGSVNFKKVEKLVSIFTNGSTEKINMKYLGLNVSKDKEYNIVVEQEDYIRNIEPIYMSKKRQSFKNHDLSEKEKNIITH